jgi:hypothetical protein
MLWVNSGGFYMKKSLIGAVLVFLVFAGTSSAIASGNSGGSTTGQSKSQKNWQSHKGWHTNKNWHGSSKIKKSK